MPDFELKVKDNALFIILPEEVDEEHIEIIREGKVLKVSWRPAEEERADFSLPPPTMSREERLKRLEELKGIWKDVDIEKPINELRARWREWDPLEPWS
jgi:hypothetical protein